jgi:hypothetical protein
LHGIFRIGVVVENATRNPVEPAIVLLHDRAVGTRIVGKCSPYQLGVVGNSWNWPINSGLGHDNVLSSYLDGLRVKRFPVRRR